MNCCDIYGNIEVLTINATYYKLYEFNVFRAATINLYLHAHKYGHWKYCRIFCNTCVYIFKYTWTFT